MYLGKLAWCNILNRTVSDVYPHNDLIYSHRANKKSWIELNVAG